MKPLTRTFKAGTSLFHENDRSRELYLVQSGRIRVYRKVGTREIELASVSKGGVLGEMALIDGKPRSASAKAVEETSVVIIDSDTFYTKIRGVPPWFMTLIRMVSQRIRKANSRLEDMQDTNQGINIVVGLQYLFYENAGGGGSCCTPLDLHRCKKELSQLLSTSQQRIVRILDQLHRTQIISVNDTTVTCCDPGVFSSMCTFFRMYARKKYNKLQMVAPQLGRVIVSIDDTILSTVTADEKKYTLEGSYLEQALGEAGIAVSPLEILDTLSEIELLSYKKSELNTRDGESSLSGMMLAISIALWQQYAQYYRFKDCLPE